jgi:hypothetical protein
MFEAATLLGEQAANKASKPIILTFGPFKKVRR